MSSIPSTPLTILLQSSDVTLFEVDEDIVFQSNLIKKMAAERKAFESAWLEIPFRMERLDSWTLEKILVWCAQHVGVEYTPKVEGMTMKLTHEDETFINEFTIKQLLDVLEVHIFFNKNNIQGAIRLDVPGLVDIITQKIVKMINVIDWNAWQYSSVCVKAKGDYKSWALVALRNHVNYTGGYGLVSDGLEKNWLRMLGPMKEEKLIVENPKRE